MHRKHHVNHNDYDLEPQSNLAYAFKKRMLVPERMSNQNQNENYSEDGNGLQYFQWPSYSKARPSTSRKLEDVFQVDAQNLQPTYDEGFIQPGSHNSLHIGWQVDDDIRGQHRTTSMHRNNFYGRDDSVERNNTNTIENRRQWMSHSGTNGRQSLLDHAERIVNFMKQDELLMTDSPDAEQQRRTALRDMPQSLAVKKFIKRKLLMSVSDKQKSLSCGKMLKYSISMWFLQIKNGLNDLLYSLELWYSTIKKIEGNFGSAVSTYFKFLRWLFVLNVLITILSFGFVSVPQIIYMQTNTENNSTKFSIADIFTGDGYFTNTILFYGFYTNNDVNNTYSMPVSYFFTMVVIYILMFLIISISMASSYRKSFIETKGGLKNIYAHKIFCGWDYGIATVKAANLKSNTIYHELQELLNDTISNSKRRSCTDRFLTLTIQTTMNIIILGLLAAAGFVLWILLDWHRESANTDADSTGYAVLVAVYINVIILLLPMLFRYIARYEDYKTPKIALYVTLVRIFILQVMVVSILIVYWVTHSEDEECWETSIGQEIYRLVLFDFIFSVILVTVFEIIRYLIFNNFWQQIGETEFDIARNTLSVVYNQTLFWTGLLYSPLLGVIIIIKLLLTWYIRSWIVMKYCVPAKKSWRASQTQTWFLILTFLCLLLVLGGHAYVIINIHVSNCGPFRDYHYILEIFTKLVLDVDEGSAFWIYLSYIGQPGVIALVLIGMSMLVYYLRARSKAQINLVKFLRGRLILAAKDKEFLLRQISKVTGDQWTFSHQEARDDFMDPRQVVPNMFTAIQDYNSSSTRLPTSENESSQVQSSNRRY